MSKDFFMSKVSVYEIITSEVVKSLELGVIPWRKPWKGDSVPCNFMSKRQYSGLNLFLLNSKPFNSKYFLTFLQVQELGGKIKKGEKATPVIFWKMLEKNYEKNGEVKKEEIPILRYYSVFNAEQIEGVDFKEESEVEEDKIFSPIEKAENLLCSVKERIPRVEYSESRRAFFKPSDDFIHLPFPEFFEKREEYYSTLFHEIIHSTGHKERLNRDTLTDAVFFGDTNYSKEELVAEMGATFLCSHCDILDQTFENSKAYINSWISKLRKNPKLVVEASSQAQKAMSFLLNLKKREE
jgi:antirestriction protein ArdC